MSSLEKKKNLYIYKKKKNTCSVKLNNMFTQKWKFIRKFE